jgi:asparagine synthase (glutamine-hydrolysing)
MSRIAGLVSDAGEGRAQLLDRALAGLRPDESWVSRALSGGRASLAWCGWGEANVASSGGVLAVMDGVVYNREELGGEGSDADLVCRLYLDHGPEGALRRLNGDFALALYDRDSDTLWLARDRFGLRPLYYTTNDKLVAFASRPRALLSLPGVPRRANPAFTGLFAASHYRYFDNDPDASPFAGVCQVPPATLLQIRGGRVSRTTWWQLAEQPNLEGTEEELAARYRDLLVDAVRIRLRRARRPVFTLSGGMDSSSVLASAVRVAGQKQQAVSSVYEDKTYDESAEIATILDDCVERWHPVRLGTPDVFAVLPRMIAAHDEPVATATWLSHFLICEAMAGEGFGGLFGGLGGDELNAGEYEYFFYHFADLRAAGEEGRLAHEVAKWVEYHDHPIFRKGPAVMEEVLSRVVDFGTPGRCLPDRRRMLRYAAVLEPSWFDLGGFEPRMDHPFTSYLKNRTYQDLTRETIPCCLRAEDRQATAFGLDNFLPFFDHRLAELMFRVRGEHKIRAGVTKRLLRRAMKGILPESTRTRIKKTGWNAPAHVWFSGGCRDQLMDLIRSRRFRERGLYRPAAVERLADDHFRIVTEGTREDNHMMFFWQLVNLELWFQVCIDG